MPQLKTINDKMKEAREKNSIFLVTAFVTKILPILSGAPLRGAYDKLKPHRDLINGLYADIETALGTKDEKQAVATAPSKGSSLSDKYKDGLSKQMSASLYKAAVQLAQLSSDERATLNKYKALLADVVETVWIGTYTKRSQEPAIAAQPSKTLGTTFHPTKSVNAINPAPSGPATRKPIGVKSS